MDGLYANTRADTGWLGRRKQSQRLVDASHEFYVEALKETHSAIISPKTAYSDATLASCNALGIYEALECPGGTMSAYYWHRAASYRLIRLRGPAAHQDGPSHRLFTNFRFFGVRVSTSCIFLIATLTDSRYCTLSITAMTPSYRRRSGRRFLSPFIQKTNSMS